MTQATCARTFRAYIAVIISLLGLVPLAAHAAKSDIVLLRNGNAITGEIKSLEFGALKYSTDSMGTVTIDWEDVVSVTTRQTLQVEVTDGSRYFGTLDSPEDRFAIRVVLQTRNVELPTEQIVRMTPIEADGGIIDRLDGSFSLGFTSEKSSEVTTLNSATDLRYRVRQYQLGLTANFSITDQPGKETSQRDNIGLSYQRFRSNRWFTDWFLNWEKNQELGINSRYLAGGGLGRYLVQNNRNQFSITGGINGTQESFVGEDESTSKLEGRIQFRYLHRNLSPEGRVSFTSNIYPLLGDLSKYRAETDLSLRREFIDDLFLDLTVYHSYTSDPPTGAAGTDYGVTTSVGYSW